MGDDAARVRNLASLCTRASAFRSSRSPSARLPASSENRCSSSSSKSRTSKSAMTRARRTPSPQMIGSAQQARRPASPRSARLPMGASLARRSRTVCGWFVRSARPTGPWPSCVLGPRDGRLCEVGDLAGRGDRRDGALLVIVRDADPRLGVAADLDDGLARLLEELADGRRVQQHLADPTERRIGAGDLDGVGHVSQVQDDALDPRILEAVRRDDLERPPRAGRRRPHPVDRGRVHPGVAQGAHQVRDAALLIIRVHHLEDVLVDLGHRVEPEDPLHGRARVDELGLVVVDDDRVARGARKDPQQADGSVRAVLARASPRWKLRSSAADRFAVPAGSSRVPGGRRTLIVIEHGATVSRSRQAVPTGWPRLRQPERNPADRRRDRVRTSSGGGASPQQRWHVVILPKAAVQTFREHRRHRRAALPDGASGAGDEALRSACVVADEGRDVAWPAGRGRDRTEGLALRSRDHVAVDEDDRVVVR